MVRMFDAFGTLPNSLPGFFARKVTETEVRHNVDKYLGTTEGVSFHAGLFKNTVPAFAEATARPGAIDMDGKHRYSGPPIAVLRVDGNFYDSYQDAMYYLYERVPVGGYVIFDDLGNDEPTARFWREFKKEQNLTEKLTQIDWTGTYFRK